MPDREYTRQPLDGLRENPHQGQLIGDVPEAELQALAESMRANGLDKPIEILPEGTILDGHQRVRAARLLKWTEIDVVVRHDLAGCNDSEQKLYLLENSLLRRNLGPLGKARVISQLVEIERDCRRDQFRITEKRTLRDRVAARMGGQLSGRQLARYLKLLDLPRHLQDAVDRGDLPMSAALSFLRLGRSTRQAQLQATPEPAALAAAMRPRAPATKAPMGPNMQPMAVLKSLTELIRKHGVDLLSGEDAVPALEAVARLLGELLAAAQIAPGIASGEPHKR